MGSVAATTPVKRGLAGLRSPCPIAQDPVAEATEWPDQCVKIQ